LLSPRLHYSALHFTRKDKQNIRKSSSEIEAEFGVFLFRQRRIHVSVSLIIGVQSNMMSPSPHILRNKMPPYSVINPSIKFAVCQTPFSFNIASTALADSITDPAGE
jgi:hypothetical protein